MAMLRSSHGMTAWGLRVLVGTTAIGAKRSFIRNSILRFQERTTLLAAAPMRCVKLCWLVSTTRHRPGFSVPVLAELFGDDL
jgi:hypothetical protein